MGVCPKREPYLSLKRAICWETVFHSETLASLSPGMRILEHALKQFITASQNHLWGPLSKPGQEQLWKWIVLVHPFYPLGSWNSFFFPNIVSHLRHSFFWERDNTNWESLCFEGLFACSFVCFLQSQNLNSKDKNSAYHVISYILIIFICF